MVQEKDLAYLAGIIDGEGFVGVKRHKANRKLGGWQYQPGIHISNTNILIIDAATKIMEECGVGHHITPQTWKDPRLNRKIVHGINCCGFKRCFRCLWLVEPYLHGKARQARITMAYIWSRFQSYRNCHIPYSDDELELVEALFDLNQRGPNILNEHTLGVADKAAKICSELRGKPVEVTEMVTRLDEFKGVRVYK